MNRSFWFCTGKSCTVCSRPFHRCGKTAITLPTLGAPSRPVTRQPGGSIYTATLHRASEMKLQTSANGARRGVLEGYLFALFGYLVDAVGDISHVEFQSKPPRLEIGRASCRERVEISGV